MAMACNLLTTIGGTPAIANQQSVARYPGSLPGGVRPGLVVYLSGLSEAFLQGVLMELEFPQNGPVAFAVPGETFPTIGDFYDAIANAFIQNQHEITGERQLSASGGLLGQLKAIQSLDDAKEAIARIKEQGEGTTTSPNAVHFGGELAHFYRLAEIKHGRSLVEVSSNEWRYEGALVPFPDVLPVGKVPSGGYFGIPEIDAFDQQFSKLLRTLEDAWAEGNQEKLDEAMYMKMRRLASAGKAIMEMPIGHGPSTYAPCFRFV